jgi:hypothetical protein
MNHDPQRMGLGETVHIQFSFLEVCQNLDEILKARKVVFEAAVVAAAAKAVMPD